MSGGYRPPSKEPRGGWARHIHAKRREWGWSATRGFEAVHKGLGLSPKSRSAYLPLDSGKRQPTSQEAEALAAVYGWPPESPTEALDATETPDSVLAAVKLLLNEIQAERAARVEWERGLLSALRELATGKAPRDDHERELRAAAGR